MGAMLVLLIMISMLPTDIMAKTVTGDVMIDPIVVQQKQTKNTKFTKDNPVKYFKVIVKEAGILKVTYSSEKMKKTVDLSLAYDDNQREVDHKTIKYNKSKKLAKGTLTSSYIVHPGAYLIIVKAGAPAAADTKFTLKTSLTKKKYNDSEPNNEVDHAQSMSISSKAKTYKMFLAGTEYSNDMIDYFKFNLKKDQKVKISASTNKAAEIRVLLKKKVDGAYVTVNSNVNDQYFKKNGSKYTFTYTNTLEKGDYYLMIWLQDEQNIQVEYSISAVAK